MLRPREFPRAVNSEIYGVWAGRRWVKHPNPRKPTEEELVAIIDYYKHKEGR